MPPEPHHPMSAVFEARGMRRSPVKSLRESDASRQLSKINFESNILGNETLLAQKLQKIGTKVADAMEIDRKQQSKVRLLDSPSFSAYFAPLPEHIHISKGCLKKFRAYLLEKKGYDLSEDHIASLMAHEMRHHQQHILDPREDKSWLQFELHQKEQEMDADRHMILGLQKAGYNPRASLDTFDFFMHMSENERDVNLSHPTSPERSKWLRSMIESPEKVVYNLDKPFKTINKKTLDESKRQNIFSHQAALSDVRQLFEETIKGVKQYDEFGELIDRRKGEFDFESGEYIEQPIPEEELKELREKNLPQIPGKFKKALDKADNIEQVLNVLIHANHLKNSGVEDIDKHIERATEMINTSINEEMDHYTLKVSDKAKKVARQVLKEFGEFEDKRQDLSGLSKDELNALSMFFKTNHDFKRVIEHAESQLLEFADLKLKREKSDPELNESDKSIERMKRHYNKAIQSMPHQLDPHIHTQHIEEVFNKRDPKELKELSKRLKRVLEPDEISVRVTPHLMKILEDTNVSKNRKMELIAEFIPRGTWKNELINRIHGYTGVGLVEKPPSVKELEKLLKHVAPTKDYVDKHSENFDTDLRVVHEKLLRLEQGMSLIDYVQYCKEKGIVPHVDWNEEFDQYNNRSDGLKTLSVKQIEKLGGLVEDTLQKEGEKPFNNFTFGYGGGELRRFHPERRDADAKRWLLMALSESEKLKSPEPFIRLAERWLESSPKLAEHDLEDMAETITERFGNKMTTDHKIRLGNILKKFIGGRKKLHKGALAVSLAPKEAHSSVGDSLDSFYDKISEDPTADFAYYNHETVEPKVKTGLLDPEFDNLMKKFNKISFEEAISKFETVYQKGGDHRDIQLFTLMKAEEQRRGLDGTPDPREVDALIEEKNSEKEGTGEEFVLRLADMYDKAAGIAKSEGLTALYASFTMFARRRLDKKYANSFKKQVDFILEHYPEHTKFRDELLRDIVNKTPTTLDQYSFFKDLLTESHMHEIKTEEKEVSFTTSVQQTLKEIAKGRTEPEDRRQVLEWLFYSSDREKSLELTPDVVKRLSYYHGKENPLDIGTTESIHFTETPARFRMGTPEEQTAVIEELCLGQKGLFEWHDSKEKLSEVAEEATSLVTDVKLLHSEVDKGIRILKSYFKLNFDERPRQVIERETSASDGEEYQVFQEQALGCFEFRNLISLEKELIGTSRLSELQAEWTEVNKDAWILTPMGNRAARLARVDLKEFNKILDNIGKSLKKWVKTESSKKQDGMWRQLSHASNVLTKIKDLTPTRHVYIDRERRYREYHESGGEIEATDYGASRHGHFDSKKEEWISDESLIPEERIRNVLGVEKPALTRIGESLTFLENLFDKMTSEAEEGSLEGLETEKLKSFFMNTFVFSSPHQRTALLMRLQSIAEKKNGYEMITTFLDSADFFGRKIAQVMSEEGKLNKELTDALATMKHQASPIHQSAAFEVLEHYTNSQELPEEARAILKNIALVYPVLASASLKQVHRVKMEDGTIQIIKYVRPVIKKLFEHSATKMRNILEAFNTEFPESAIDLKFIDTVINTAREEIDLNYEAEVQNAMRESRKGQRGRLKVGKMQFVSDGLIMEEEMGLPLSHYEQLKQTPKVKAIVQTLTKTAARDFMFQLLQDGIIHADMHTGNITIDPNGRMGLIDCGAAVDLRKDPNRRSYVNFLSSMILDNPRAGKTTLLKIMEKQKISKKDMKVLESIIANTELGMEGKISGLLNALRKMPYDLPDNFMKLLLGLKKVSPVISRTLQSEGGWQYLLKSAVNATSKQQKRDFAKIAYDSKVRPKLRRLLGFA